MNVTPEQIALGRRAVAAGMTPRASGHILISTFHEGPDGASCRRAADGTLWLRVLDPEGNWAWIPDLFDPACHGVLLAQVRKKWNDPKATPVYVAPTHVPGPGWNGGWEFQSEAIRAALRGPMTSEEWALVCALEAEPAFVEVKP